MFFYGKDGGPEHFFIIDIVRSLVNAILRYKDNKEFGCVCAEPLVHQILGQSRLEGIQYPDVMFTQGDYPVMVEVGSYQPSKWTCPVIHIELDRTVSTINWIPARFTTALLRAVIVALFCVKTRDNLNYYMSQVCQEQHGYQ